MRSRAGAAAAPGRPVRAVAFQHHDLLPGRCSAAAVRAAAARAALVIVPSRAVAQDLDPGARAARATAPGRRAPRGRRRALRPRPSRPGRRRCWCSARSSAGSAPTWRSRSARWRAAAARTCGCDSSGRRSTRRWGTPPSRPRCAAVDARRRCARRIAAPAPDLEARSSSPGRSRTRPPSWPAPAACCTAPRASRSAWPCSRRSPPAVRSSSPAAAGPAEIVDDLVRAAATRRATPRRRPPRC